MCSSHWPPRDVRGSQKSVFARGRAWLAAEGWASSVSSSSSVSPELWPCHRVPEPGMPPRASSPFHSDSGWGTLEACRNKDSFRAFAGRGAGPPGTPPGDGLSPPEHTDQALVSGSPGGSRQAHRHTFVCSFAHSPDSYQGPRSGQTPQTLNTHPFRWLPQSWMAQYSGNCPVVQGFSPPCWTRPACSAPGPLHWQLPLPERLLPVCKSQGTPPGFPARWRSVSPHHILALCLIRAPAEKV